MFTKKELLLDSLVTNIWNYQEKNSLLDTEELDVLEQEQLEEIEKILTMLSQYEAMED